MKLYKIFSMAIAVLAVAVGCLFTQIGNAEAADTWVYNDGQTSYYVITDSIYKEGNKYSPTMFCKVKYVDNASGSLRTQKWFKFDPVEKTELMYIYDTDWEIYGRVDSNSFANAVWNNCVVQYTPWYHYYH